MDIARCLDRIRPNAEWGTAATYADLERTWRDTQQTLPTEAELAEVWQTLQAEDAAAAQDEADLAAARLLIEAAMVALKNGTGTAAERLTRVERAVWWLLRQSLR